MSGDYKRRIARIEFILCTILVVVLSILVAGDLVVYSMNYSVYDNIQNTENTKDSAEGESNQEHQTECESSDKSDDYNEPVSEELSTDSAPDEEITDEEITDEEITDEEITDKENTDKENTDKENTDKKVSYEYQEPIVPNSVIEINENVYVFSDEECEQINNSIESFQINSNGIVINMLQNVPFDNLEDGSLFFVKGTSDSVFGAGYFGKITSRTNGEGYTSYVIETPLFEEVFDRIKFNATQTLNYNDISKFVVYENVNLSECEDLSLYFTEAKPTNGMLVDYNVDLFKNYGTGAVYGITGQVGLQDLSVNLCFDWDVNQDNALRNFNTKLEGAVYQKNHINASIKNNLNDNMNFVLASVTYDVMLYYDFMFEDQLLMVDNMLPLSIEHVISTDVDGNVSRTYSADFVFNQKFNYSNNIVKDGEWIDTVELSETETHYVGFIADQDGNNDTYFGVGFSYSIFNFDLYEMNVLGIEEHSYGKYKIDAVNNTLDKAGNTYNSTYVFHLYYEKYISQLKLSGTWMNPDYASNKAAIVSLKLLSGKYVAPTPPRPQVVPTPQVPQTPSVNGTGLQAIHVNVPVYRQYDERWGSKYISTKTLGQVGCLVTALSMKHSYHMGRAIYPDEMMYNYLTFYINLVEWNSVGRLGYYYTQKYKCPITNTLLTVIYQQLAKGKPVVIGGTNDYGGMHWVVITGHKGNSTGILKAEDFLINDPDKATNTNLAQFLAKYPKVERLVY